MRPSASASVKDPATGLRLKAGEHVFVLIDDPDQIEGVSARDPAVGVVHRLPAGSAGWICAGKGWRSTSPMGRSTPPSVRRNGWFTRARSRSARASSGCHAKAVGDRRPGRAARGRAAPRSLISTHPWSEYNELVEAAKNEPAFLSERQAAVKAAYRAAKIEEGVVQRVAQGTAQGKSREEVEKEVEKDFDRVTQAKAVRFGGRIWRELSPHHVLYRTDGTPFLVSDMVGNRDAFHKKECADPVEGLKYLSRNPGLILFQDTRIAIYSRAHSDAYAYFFPLFDTGGDDDAERSRRQPQRD